MSTPFDNCFWCNKSTREVFLRDITGHDVGLWTLFCKIFRVSPKDEFHLKTFLRCRLCYPCHSLAVQTNEVLKKIEMLQNELEDLSGKLKDVVRKTTGSEGNENACVSTIESNPLESLRIFFSKNLNLQLQQPPDAIHVMPVWNEELEQDDDDDVQAQVDGICNANASNEHYGNSDTLEPDADSSCSSNLAEMRKEVGDPQIRTSSKNFRTFTVQGHVLKDLEIKLERLSKNFILNPLGNRWEPSGARNCGDSKSPDHQDSDGDESWVGKSSSGASSEGEYGDREINLPAKSLRHRKQEHNPNNLKNHMDEDKLQCLICMKVLSARKYLVRHMQLHEGKNHVCEICGSSLRSRTLLRQHKKKRHGKDKVCNQCGKAYAFNYELKEHERSHRKGERTINLTCIPCDTTFASPEAFLEHRIEKHNADGGGDEENLQCLACVKVFSSCKSFRRHMQLHEGKNHVCEACGSSFKSRAALRHHTKRIHNKDKVCNQCGKAFAYDCELKDHERSHLKGERIRMFTCKPCDKTYSSGEAFLDHRKEKHIADGDVDEENLLCLACMKVFSSRKNFRGHMELHKDKTQMCEICGSSYHSRRHLNRHIKRKHNRDKICAECGKAFAFDYELKDHEQTHGTEERTSKKKRLCELCGKDVIDLLTHKTYCLEKLKKTEEKHFSCSHCDATFHLEVSLRRHERLTHSNRDRFECEVCQKKFQFKCLLTQHRRSHFPEEGIPCTMCSAKFKRAQDLKWHVEYEHHGNRDKCSICGYEAKNRKIFRQHELQHKLGRRFECDICGKKFFKGHHMKRHRRSHEKSEQAEEANTDLDSGSADESDSDK